MTQSKLAHDALVEADEDPLFAPVADPAVQRRHDRHAVERDAR